MLLSQYFCRIVPKSHYRSLMTFEGQVSVGGTSKVSDEEKISKIFGNSIKGKSSSKLSKSTSRYIVNADSRTIAGVKVPNRPKEPDNCCMSGCVNCVWEYYNEDLRHWQQRRRTAIKEISNTNDVWPEDWDPPVNLLPMKNLPESLHPTKLELERQKSSDKTSNSSQQQLKQLFPSRNTPLPQSVIEAKRRNQLKKQQQQQQQEANSKPQQIEDDEGWSDVPIHIKVFAQFERKKRLQRQKEKLERRAREAGKQYTVTQ